MAETILVGTYFARRLEPSAGDDPALRRAFDAITDCLLIWTSARSQYPHWCTLLDCCRAVVANLGSVPFAGRLTLAKIMGDSMALLKKEHGLDAPGPWVLIIRELRATPDKKPFHCPYGWQRDDGVEK